jgi:hypothetical protein
VKHKSIDIKSVTIIELAHYPAKPDPTHVLVLKSRLTLALADQLKCKDLAFDINDVARQFEGKVGLTHQLSDVEVQFPGFMGEIKTVRPSKIQKFRIFHDGANMGLEFRVHFKGVTEGIAVNDLLTDQNLKEFDFGIVSLQGELFDVKPTGDGNDGKRIDMSGGDTEPPEEIEDPDAECMHCDRDIEIDSSNSRYHVNGMPCPLAERAEAVSSGSLASAREVAGGTTAALRKRGRPRKVNKA